MIQKVLLQNRACVQTGVGGELSTGWKMNSRRLMGSLKLKTTSYHIVE
jgi:hypothetical protein